jgi:hypothetical protein
MLAPERTPASITICQRVIEIQHKGHIRPMRNHEGDNMAVVSQLRQDKPFVTCGYAHWDTGDKNRWKDHLTEIELITNLFGDDLFRQDEIGNM